MVCYAPDGKNTMDDVWMDPGATKGESFNNLSNRTNGKLRAMLTPLAAYVDEWEDTGKGKIATKSVVASLPYTWLVDIFTLQWDRGFCKTPPNKGRVGSLGARFQVEMGILLREPAR